MVPEILIFPIAMVANYSFDVKNIDIWAHAFFKHNNSFIDTVWAYITANVTIRFNSEPCISVQIRVWDRYNQS